QPPGRGGDTSSMRARLTSSRFVGRTGELAELELALGEASARRPALVLVGGHSGVGKSRLVAEFERRVAGDEVLLLRGGGMHRGGRALPSAPWRGARRPRARQQPPAPRALSAASRARLAALPPALGDGRAPPAAGSDPAGQLRLFEPLLELFEQLSETQ